MCLLHQVHKFKVSGQRNIRGMKLAYLAGGFFDPPTCWKISLA